MDHYLVQGTSGSSPSERVNEDVDTALNFKENQQMQLEQDGKNVEKPLYTANALAAGEGRNGTARTSDGKLDVTLASPVELGGTGRGTNPEQLFAAGYAACFHSALRMLALKERADLTDSAVAAKVHLVQPDGTAYVLEVELEVALPVLDLSTAEALVARAHAICPYSNATRGNITVDIRILEYAA